MKVSFSKVVGVIYKHKEIPIAVVIAFTISSLAIYIYLNQGSLKKEQNNNQIQISGNISAPNNSNVASKGELINWQKSIGVNSEATNLDGTIIEQIDENQAFSGDVKLPPGWTIEYSCDPRDTPESNRTYNNPPGCALANVTFLKINTGTAQTLKPHASASLVKPPAELSILPDPISSLPPIQFKNKLFQIMKAVRVEDAGSESDYTINCFDMDTYATCTGAAFPAYLSTNIGPLGVGQKNINTPQNMQSYVDDGTNGSLVDKGKLYFPGQNGNSYGVVCVNLNTLSNCGFISLGTSGATYGGLGNPVVLSGFIKSGSKLYGHANDSDKTNQTVVCFDLNSDGSGTDAPCADYSSDTTAPTTTYRISEHANSYYTTGVHLVANNKLYWTVDYSSRNSNATNLFPPAGSQRGWGTVITCFDLATKGSCAGWPNYHGGVNRLNSNGGLYTSLARPNTLFAWLNPNNSVRAVCLIVGLYGGTDPSMLCHDINDGSAITDVNGIPEHPAKMIPSILHFLYWTGSPYTFDATDNEGNKTYFPFYNTNTNSMTESPKKGATICWNWTTGNKCADFAKPKYWYGINDNNSGDIGYIYDGACMWGFGNENKIWSFDSKTGETPCRSFFAKQDIKLNANAFYCDGANHVFNWGKVRLSRANKYDFQTINVIVKDKLGNTILQQGDIKSTAELDLSSVSYQAYPELFLEVSTTVHSTSPWANDNKPLINVTANADNAQYCYKTTTKHYCDIDQIITQTNANILDNSDTLVANKNFKIGLNQPAEEQCFKDVKISIEPNKTNITDHEEIIYTIKVKSKANANSFNRGNINGAKIEASIPANFKYVSSDNNGVADSGKVVWNSQSINANGTITRSFTIEPTKITSFLEQSNPINAYAATSQSNIVVSASVISDDDIYQSDNSIENSSAVLTTVTNSSNNTTESTPTSQVDNQNDNIADERVDDVNQNAQTDNRVVAKQRSLNRGIFSKLNNFVGGIVHSVAIKVPPNVAVAIPYGLISFLVAFAILYIYQAYKATMSRNKILKLHKQFTESQKLKQNFMDLVSHYLNTPIAVMGSSIELLANSKQIPKKLAETVKIRIEKLNMHIQSITGSFSGSESQVVKEEAVKQEGHRIGVGILAPLIGVLVITIGVNMAFVDAGKYKLTVNTTAVQVILFVFSSIALITAHLIFRNQKIAENLAKAELINQQKINNMQSKLINSINKDINNDLIELEQILPEVSSLPRGKLFYNGLIALKRVAEKLTYLGSLTNKQVSPIMPNNTVKEITDKIVKDLQDFAESRNVTIDIDVQPGITLAVDEVGLRFLLQSTLHNAIKFNRVGGKVKLTIKGNKKFIDISVKDNGKGISDSLQKQLFKPFSKEGDAHHFNYEGMGIDLYMSKLIADQNGGNIKISSSTDQGTTITTQLPA